MSSPGKSLYKSDDVEALLGDWLKIFDEDHPRADEFRKAVKEVRDVMKEWGPDHGIFVDETGHLAIGNRIRQRP